MSKQLLLKRTNSLLLKRFICLATLPWLLLNLGCEEAEVGSKQRPFSMYFVPHIDSQGITTTSEHMATFVERFVSKRLYNKETGFYVKQAVPTSYIAVIEAMGSGKADFGGITTFSYILAKDIKGYELEAVLMLIRSEGHLSYKGQFIAHADSGIHSLKDLSGKKFAYTDPASTAGYIAPSIHLRDHGVQLGEVVFANRHDNVVAMVYQKQVDAGATYYTQPRRVVENGKVKEIIQDARAMVKTQFPDVEEKVKVVDYTMDLPNAPWAIRTNLYTDPAKNQKVKQAVVDALHAYAQTKEGKEQLMQGHNVIGLIPIEDSHYNEVRRLLADADIDVETIVRKKAKKAK